MLKDEAQQLHWHLAETSLLSLDTTEDTAMVMSSPLAGTLARGISRGLV